MCRCIVGTKQKHIRECCQGHRKRKEAFGFQWKRLSDVHQETLPEVGIEEDLDLDYNNNNNNNRADLLPSPSSSSSSSPSPSPSSSSSPSPSSSPSSWVRTPALREQQMMPVPAEVTPPHQCSSFPKKYPRFFFFFFFFFFFWVCFENK